MRRRVTARDDAGTGGLMISPRCGPSHRLRPEWAVHGRDAGLGWGIVLECSPESPPASCPGGLHQPVRPNRNRFDRRRARSPELACHRSRGPFLDVQQRKMPAILQCQAEGNAAWGPCFRHTFSPLPAGEELESVSADPRRLSRPRAIHSRRAAGARHHAISGHDPFHDMKLRQNSRRTSRTRVAGRVIQAYTISAYGLK